ncbi:hypothetical protein TI39_contig853g00002 [Zymoseptoria brevis]|uniref:Short-chain dehydrogenase like protein n=1 Tax=Zymoseptoria brevis TaxID=1047168 RepID=A0A0F4GIE0_9PEZI|nr:hypothetical protein TI39_contig853g00002 [Zymoseptoria brevis]
MASTKTRPQPAEIDLIPYDAPLSITEPTKAWLNSHGGSLRSEYRNTLPESTVPGCDLTNKWIIISGSNNGIGRDAALSFAKWGANLILACRDPPPHETHPTAVVEECLKVAKEAGHVSEIEWWELDNADLKSVESFAKRWLDTGRGLDVLCNNAGMGGSPGGSDAFLTKDGFEIVHQVNFLAHVLLTLSLLPSLAKTKDPRIVCTTSCFHYLGKYNIANFNGGPRMGGLDGVQYYQNNKLYFQIWLTELQHRLDTHPEYAHITINGVHPGYVNSGIWKLTGEGLVHTIKQFAVNVAASYIGIDTQQGSMCITNAATNEECWRKGGRYFNRVYETESMPHCRDRDARLRVWRKVDEELKLRDKGLLDVVGLWSTE